jgi:hypothetical protein
MSSQLMDYRTAKAYERSRLNSSQDISSVKPGGVVYVDLRVFGGRWYEGIMKAKTYLTGGTLHMPWSSSTHTGACGDSSYKKNGRPDLAYTRVLTFGCK